MALAPINAATAQAASSAEPRVQCRIVSGPDPVIGIILPQEDRRLSPSLNAKDGAKIVYEARGLCLILGPWNFPLGLVLGPLAAAVAAGNCCIVKLTDLCPATASVAARIIKESFEEKEVALFEGGVDMASALLELPFNHIFFTGSTRVGKIVMAAAATNLATVTLELGGKSPVVVDEDADLKKLAADLAAAKQFNGGQACICPDYVFIREEQAARKRQVHLTF